MNIPRVKFRNFFSFLEGEMTFEKGVNYVLGDNGSGKSTAVIYAICWGLYGITPKGLRGDDVINSGVNRNCMVEVQVDIDSDTYIIRRFRKHSKYRNGIFIEKNGNDISTTTASATDGLIEEILGMDFTTFICSCVFPQNALIRFSNIGDAEKKAILERTRQSFPFDDWRREAKDKLDKIDSETSLLGNEKDKVLVSLGDGQAILRQQKDSENIWELRHNKEIEDLENDEIDTDNHMGNYSERVDILHKNLVDLKAKYINSAFETKEKTDEKVKAIDKYINETSDVAQATVDMLTKIKARKLSVRNDIERYTELIGKGECPIIHVPCEQLTSGGAFSTEKELMETEIEGLDGKIATLEKIFSHSDKVCKKKSEERILCVNKLYQEKELASEIRNVEKRIKDFKSSINDLKNRHKRLEIQIGNKRKEKFAGVDTSEMENLLKKYHREVIRFSNEINSWNELRPYYEFWLIGYGKSGLRSFLLDQVCIDLEELAQGYLSELANGMIELTISTQSKLASGELREKISVNVTSPKGMTKYKGASGGQERRIDLALLLAMKDIASKNLPSKPEILFIDEVFDSLDAIGKERAVILLAEGEGTTVLITHDPELVNVLPFVNATEFELVDGVSMKKEL